MTAVNGPALWDKLLGPLKSLYGDAVVAGGAVRDWAHSETIKPKDIDIFVPVNDTLDWEAAFYGLEDLENFSDPYVMSKDGYTNKDGSKRGGIVDVISVCG